MMQVFDKTYEKIMKFIRDNYKFLLLYVGVFLLLTWPLPYYIYTGGGTIDVNDKVTIEEQSESSGSFNLAYVAEVRATIPTYLLHFFFSAWELVEVSDMTMSENETVEDVLLRDKLYLDDANQSAISVSYQAAGKTFEVTSTKARVAYIADGANTNLQISDTIMAIDSKEIHSLEELQKIVRSHEVGDRLEMAIERNGETMTAYAIVQESEGQKLVGISLLQELEYKTDPALSLSFSANESGPSGGLLLALSIYDKLVPEDITKGRKIVGTGTIDQDGNVGEIGGVRYKLQGAVREGADIFLVPNGNNYKECIQLQQEKGYDITIIGVSTFQEALDALSKTT